jgi:isoquinoline 1-oxidoreductase
VFEPERYELHDRPVWRFRPSRRGFFGLVGGGLVVAVALEGQESGGGRRGGGQPAPREVSAWLHIAEDGTVTVYTGKAEVGQNARTSLAQAVAEELHAPIQSIRMVMADTDLTPYDAGTFGSRTTPAMAPQLRRAGATAREMLLDLAAEHWKTERAGLTAAEGRVTRRDTGESISFGSLTKGQKLLRTIPGDAAVSKPLAQSVTKVNAADLVTGRHQFASDIQRPGMLHGRVLRRPAVGAKLASVDATAAEQMAGVTVVRDGEFVGVAATDPLTAERALQALRPQWETTAQPSSGELFEILKSKAGKGSGNTAGSIEEGLAAADHKLEAVYTVAYIAHAPLEPRAAVAEWTDGRLTVWTGTQRPFGVRSELAQAFGIPESKVRVIVPDTGSGYGGKHTGEAAVEAVRLAKAAGKPVKLVWTREEEFTWAYFRPAGVIEVTAGVRQDGTVTAWEFHNYNSGGSAIRTLYDIPNQRIEFHPAPSPLRQGSYRGLAATANHFAREMHMDELAHLAGLDPLEFRLKNLKDQRFRAVLQSAAEKFGWGRSKPAARRGYGIAGGFEKGSYIATCAEVEVDASTRAIRVVRAVSAFECGAIVNPEHLKNQVEGSVIMGLGGALWEAIEFESGRVTNGRFLRYRVPRFSDTPVLETVLIDRKDLPSAGAGETPIVCIAPAIGAAVFQATGKRLRSLPMRL